MSGDTASLTTTSDDSGTIRSSNAPKKPSTPTTASLASATPTMNESIELSSPSKKKNLKEAGEEKTTFVSKILNPATLAIIVLGLGVVVSGALLFMALVGMIHVGDKDQTDSWIEINSQVINAIFTLAALITHPFRIRCWYYFTRFMSAKRRLSHLELPSTNAGSVTSSSLTSPQQQALAGNGLIRSGGLLSNIQVVGDHTRLKRAPSDADIQNSKICDIEIATMRTMSRYIQRDFPLVNLPIEGGNKISPDLPETSLALFGWLLLLFNLNCFFQYPITVLMWAYASNHASRPSMIVYACIPCSFLTGTIAGIILSMHEKHQQKMRISSRNSLAKERLYRSTSTDDDDDNDVAAAVVTSAVITSNVHNNNSSSDGPPSSASAATTTTATAAAVNISSNKNIVPLLISQSLSATSASVPPLPLSYPAEMIQVESSAIIQVDQCFSVTPPTITSLLVSESRRQDLQQQHQQQRLSSTTAAASNTAPKAEYNIPGYQTGLSDYFAPSSFVAKLQ